METMYDRIKRLRLSMDLSQQELADLVGYASRSTVNKIEAGTRDIKADKILAFAKVFGVTPSYLMDGEDHDKVLDVTGFIPVVGRIAAGAPILVQENIIDYVPTLLKNPQEYFGLLVSGDSMVGAGITDGAYAIIHRQTCAENGQIVACRINGEEATLKRYREQDNAVILMPENSAYSPILIPKKDFSNGKAQILGVLKEVSIKY